jgi:hypothetical protein
MHGIDPPADVVCEALIDIYQPLTGKRISPEFTGFEFTGVNASLIDAGRCC